MGGSKRIIVDKGFDIWLNDLSKKLKLSKKRATEKIPDIINAQADIIRKRYKPKKKEVETFKF